MANDEKFRSIQDLLRTTDRQEKDDRGKLVSRRWFTRIVAGAMAGGFVAGTNRQALANSDCTTDTCNVDTCAPDTCTTMNSCVENSCELANTCAATNQCSESNIEDCPQSNTCATNRCEQSNVCSTNTCTSDDSCTTNQCGFNRCDTNTCSSDDSCSLSNTCTTSNTDCGFWDVSCTFGDMMA